MSYLDRINSVLKPKFNTSYTAVDLFAGCGGLSLGFEANGFSTIGYEMNVDACDTYNTNLTGICCNEMITTETEFPEADILIGGPPCQPFSVVGNQLGLQDMRNGFPICISTVKQTQPKLFLFENVKGLLYKNRWYLEKITKEFEALGYTVQVKLLNARNYDVPQNRERIFIVGFKKGSFVFPDMCSYEVTAGLALESLAFETPPHAKFITKNMAEYIKRYEIASKCVTSRDLHLDKPSRTLTCRNLAGSTGDMLRIKLPTGRRRRLVYREAGRLQSFPDWFHFNGNETSVFNQIGNAVPPMMSYHIAKAIKKYLKDNY